MSTAPKAEVLEFNQMVAYQAGSVVSRQITRAEAGNVTLFAFDAGQELSEHTAPFDALAQVLEGDAEILISGHCFRLMMASNSFAFGSTIGINCRTSSVTSILVNSAAGSSSPSRIYWLLISNR